MNYQYDVGAVCLYSIYCIWCVILTGHCCGIDDKWYNINFLCKLYKACFLKNNKIRYAFMEFYAQNPKKSRFDSLI